MCKFPFSERVLLVWFPYSQPCSHCRPTVPQIRLQRALLDGFKELNISSVIHSELNLSNCRILCHPLSVTCQKVHKVRFLVFLAQWVEKEKIHRNGGEMFTRERRHGLTLRLGQPGRPVASGGVMQSSEKVLISAEGISARVILTFKLLSAFNSADKKLERSTVVVETQCRLWKN